jgi:hypothetical protein
MQLAIKLFPYLSIGISLIVFLGLFFQLARTVEKLRSRLGKLEAQSQQAAELNARISGLNLRIEELESAGGAASPALSLKPGALSGTVRSKVLKMHRLGQPAERIADNLRVPKGEVDLLVKVHQIVMRPYEEVPSGPTEAEAS